MIKYEWNEMHGKILNDFFNALNVNSIKYFVLRNYEGLPWSNGSKDVDIIVEPGSYNVAHNELLKAYKNNGITNYYDVKFERAHCCYGMNIDTALYIHIDLIEGYLNKGFEIFTFTELYDNTVSYKNFRVLNPVYDAVMLLLYKVIGVGELKERYQIRIAEIYASNQEPFKVLIKRVFGMELGAEVLEQVENNDYESIVKKHKELSKISKQRIFVQKPFKMTKYILSFIFEKFCRVVLCPKKYRKIIAVEAPDGTGKTTFIDLLTERLAESFVTDVSKMHVYHFRPSLFPNLGELGEKAGVMEQDKDFTNPHRGKKTGTISSLIRIAYYTCDYILGGFICIRRDAQFDKFTIFDRYSYDLLVDPRRSKINLPDKVRLFFCKLTPKPTITFVLNADTATIFKRKQELTLEEIERQLAEFKKLEKIAVGYHELNSNNTPEEVVNQAMKVILTSLTGHF